MNRVAIHLSGSPPVDRNAICAVFREVQQDGGRVVVLAQDADGSDATLRDLLHRLGEDFDQLFTLAGVELYEWLEEGEGSARVAPSLSGSLH